MVRKPMKQWILKITAYADRLLEDLELVDWPESLKSMQRNWIGRSEGAEVTFAVDGHEEQLVVYTTRPDTLFGATYMVLAPEHDLVDGITVEAQRAEVDAYVKDAALKSDLDRTDLAKHKTGVFTGAYAMNPVNGERDQEVMKTLISANGIQEPTFAVRLLPLDRATTIRVGDPVAIG